MIRLRPKLCHKHPEYQAIRKPRANCLRCWTAYYEKHGMTTNQANNVAKIIVEQNELVNSKVRK